MYHRIFILLVICLAVTGCQTKPKRPQDGFYKLEFTVRDVSIPIELEISGQDWVIHNAAEKIHLTPTWPATDSFVVDIPVFHTTLRGKCLDAQHFQGTWTDPTRIKNNHTPFSAAFVSTHLSKPTTATESTKWRCTFSPNSPEDSSSAIALIDRFDTLVTGTFLTETGDYRYLSGKMVNNQCTLSCFDGTHLFYFSTLMRNDSLVNGRFISGNTWEEPWSAKLDPKAELRDPDSLTAIIGARKLAFTALDPTGKATAFDSTTFANKVTIIQIFGSWCPNCTDESRFLSDLYAQTNNPQLQIIPVAFEREAPIATQLARIKRQFDDLGIAYTPYLGGNASKNNAHSVFTQLDHISSYPTAIFIDKKSQVRKIHTGFYGPGTGKYFDHHTEQLRMFIAQLLAEN